MRQTVCRFVVAGLIVVWPLVAGAKDVYVAKTGSDDAPGTKDKPLATIAKAVDLMRGAGPGTIWIGEGQYELQQGIVLDAKHGGTAEKPLMIRGAAPGKTILSGARAVRNFQPISAAEAKRLISKEAQKHVLVADLRSQGFPPLETMPPTYRPGLEEVIFGDQPMQSARWPNDGFAVFTETIDAGASKPVHWVRREVYRPGSFRFPEDRAKHWDFQRGVWLHGFWCYDWCDEVLKAKSYDPATKELRLGAKPIYGVGSPWAKADRRRFYALHVFEELDQPGEYYLDRVNNRLYFWPPGDVTQTPVRLTILKRPLIEATGVAHLVIRDLTIENGRSVGVNLKTCRDTVIENCLLRNMGHSGIELSGARVAAIGCEVTGVATYGISMHGGDRKTLTPAECSVVNCHIHHVGRLDWMHGRCITLGGCGNRAANNLLHHGPTGAISYSGNEHVIELNEIHDMCHHYSDVGVIYTGRDWASQGNVVRWNYIHDIVNNAGHGSSGVYLDDCDSGDTVVGNIVFGGVGRGVLLGGGRDNTIRGNIFIGLPVGVHVDARGPRAITLDKPGSWNLLAKCEAVDYLSPLWRQRYPRLAATMDNEPLLPLGNSLRDNILLDCKKPFALAKEVQKAWLDQDNNLEGRLDDYPILAGEGASAKLDLAKLPTLWQKAPGFPPIPLERIGLQKSGENR